MSGPLFRANFGDGTHSDGWPDIRDAQRAMRERAGIVQWRTSIEMQQNGSRLAGADWVVIIPSRASLNGPVITEIRA